MADKPVSLIDVLNELVADIFSVRSMVTLGAFGTLYYLVLHGQDVPESINKIVDLLLGFWFGTKTAQATRTIRGTDSNKPPEQEPVK